nr:hypothetical protein [Tanacetum cinerariifolium]
MAACWASSTYSAMGWTNGLNWVDWARTLTLAELKIKVKEKREKDKIGSKPDKKREANYDPKGERFLIASRLPTPQLACAFFSPGATVTWCTGERCGIDLRDGFCLLCNSRNSCVYAPNPNSFDCPPDSYHPPHPTYETYSNDSCRIDSHLGYDCPPQFSLNYEPEPGYIQNYNSYPHDSPSFPQQYPCCDNCGGLHETFQCQPMNQNSYNSNFSGFDQSQTPQFPVIHLPPQETSIELFHNHENEPFDFLSIGDEHLDTIPATESDEVIKSSVEDLVPIPSESEGIPEHMCDVPFHDNSPPLDVSKDQIKDLSESNNEVYLIDDDSFSIDNIDFVEASPPDSELVSSKVMEIVIPEVGGIDDDILLTIKDDILREKLLNVYLLIANIEALKDNPAQSSELLTKSSSTSPKSFLEETNTFHNSFPELENFYFDFGEISSGSTTTHSDIFFRL